MTRIAILENAPEEGDMSPFAKGLIFTGVVIALAGFFPAVNAMLLQPDQGLAAVHKEFGYAIGLGLGTAVAGVIIGTFTRRQKH